MGWACKLVVNFTWCKSYKCVIAVWPCKLAAKLHDVKPHAFYMGFIWCGHVNSV